jgi:hypothetical protein
LENNVQNNLYTDKIESVRITGIPLVRPETATQWLRSPELAEEQEIATGSKI